MFMCPAHDGFPHVVCLNPCLWGTGCDPGTTADVSVNGCSDALGDACQPVSSDSRGRKTGRLYQVNVHLPWSSVFLMRRNCAHGEFVYMGGPLHTNNFGNLLPGGLNAFCSGGFHRVRFHAREHRIDQNKWIPTSRFHSKPSFAWQQFTIRVIPYGRDMQGEGVRLLQVGA